MKKNLILVLVISLLIQCIGGISVFADGTLQGEGSAESPYLIGTLNELIAFRDKINGGETTACAVLTKNIDASSQTKWTSIGTTENKYAGTFDGAGYEITGIKGTGSNDAAWGLFAYTNGGEIKNLTVSTGSDAETAIGHQAALVVGIASNDTKITKCVGYGNLSGWGYIGGITYDGDCVVTDSYYVGNIKAAHKTTAMDYASVVTNCFAYGNITADTHVFKMTNKSATNSYFLYSEGTKGTGVINAILGAAGPKRYAEVTEIPSYMAVLEATASSQPTYSVFNVNDEKISVVTKQLDGTVVDSFEIVD